MKIFYNIAFVYHSIIGFHAAHAHKKRRARAGVKLARTYGESNCHGRVFLKAFKATTYIKKYGRWLPALSITYICLCYKLSVNSRYTTGSVYHMHVPTGTVKRQPKCSVSTVLYAATTYVKAV